MWLLCHQGVQELLPERLLVKRQWHQVREQMRRACPRAW